ncbi:MAG: c-type cytochrome [Candidatus Kapaibacterium sp.]
MRKILLAALILSIIISACGKKDDQNTAIDKKQETSSSATNDLSSKGKALFYESSNLTGLKCADCHSDGTNTDKLNTKYFSDVIQASKRQSVFAGTISGEEVKKKGAGATFCWDTFLKMGRPITEEEINSFNAYFESLKGVVKESKYTTIALPKPDKSKLKEDQTKIAGLTPNIQKGEKVFKESCGFCHGGKTVKRVPSLFDEEFEGNLKSIVYHVRFGAKFMPFYSYEKLTDQDVADITEYIMKNQKK